jgi:uncharacterized membrane protein YhaH (DUF805 family)
MSEKQKRVGLLSGRLNRNKFTFYFLLSFFVYAALFYAAYQIPSDSVFRTVLGILATSLYLLVLVPIVVKRAHDLDWSGAWFWLILVPVAFIVFLVLLMVKDGTAGPNKYGEDPLGRAASQSEGA